MPDALPFKKNEYVTKITHPLITEKPFAVALYPGHMLLDDEKFILNPDVHFTKDTPPTFIVHAEDDPQDSIDNSILYYTGLKNAKVPVEMHLYAQGGHGFGVRKTNSAITEWPRFMERWLETIGMTEK